VGAAHREDAPAPVQNVAATAPKEITKENAQIGMAIIGAQQLKQSAKDPKTFELESAILMDSGAVCYQYRAHNAFNAILEGHTVLTEKTKLLVEDNDENDFVASWKRLCLHNSGSELEPYIRLNGLI
jgi:hypothetical protein